VTNPATEMEKAVEVAQMNKQQVEYNSPRLTLRQKLVKIYEEIDHIEKKGDNKKQGYKFVRSADVLREIRGAFAKFGVYAEINDIDLLGTYDIATNSGGKMHTAMVKVKIQLHDTESDEKVNAVGLGDGADSGDKGVYKAQTGAVKNALKNAFLIPDEADPEADESVDEATTAKPAPKPQPARVSSTVAVNTPAAGTPYPEPQTVQLADGPLPTDEEMVEIRKQFQALSEKLAAAGLKASRNRPVPIKLKEYLLKYVGQSDVPKVSKMQWDQFFTAVSHYEGVTGGVSELINLIDPKETK
jgi:hypothetical protein